MLISDNLLLFNFRCSYSNQFPQTYKPKATRSDKKEPQKTKKKHKTQVIFRQYHSNNLFKYHFQTPAG